jgi:four helix bundle protein
MAKIEKFEDIEAWQKSRLLCRKIYLVTGQGEFSRDYGLRDQIRRSAVSVMSNIAEGFERGGNKEFQNFLSIAKGSAGEVRAQLYVALDAGFLSHEEFDHLNNLSCETSRLISGFMRYLMNSNLRGHKFSQEP